MSYISLHRRSVEILCLVCISWLVMWSGPGDGGGIERLLECQVMDGGTGRPGPGTRSTGGNSACSIKLYS